MDLGRVVRATASPVIVHVPHAGVGLPDDGLPLPDIPDLAAEVRLMADLHVDLLADRVDALLAESGHAPPNRVGNLLSRVVMDPERFDDESEEMNQVGMGVIYTRTHDGRALYREGLPADAATARKEQWYYPYAAAFTALADRVVRDHGRCLILDLHSYATEALPCELHQADERPPVCLGVEPFHDPGAGQAARFLAEHGFATTLNQPYRGAYVPLNRYGVDPAVQSLMVEVRKDQYLDGTALRPEAADRLSQAVARFARWWVDAQNA
jgi:N-formylglutamate amidohydrolase